MKPVIVFLAICVMGFFCAWIGGVKPFTCDAGWAAFMTFLLALCGYVAMLGLNGLEDMK